MDVVLDLEGAGLEARVDPDVPLWCVGWATDTQSGTWDWSEDTVEKVLAVYERHNPIFHNGAFDIACLTIRGLPMPKQWEDTALMSYSLHPSSSEQHSLEYLGNLVGCPKSPKPDFYIDTPELREYCAQDCRSTMAVYRYLQKELKADKHAYEFYRKVEKPYSKIIMELQKGMLVDWDVLPELLAEYEEICLEETQYIQEYIGFIPGKEKKYSKLVVFYEDPADPYNPVYVGKRDDKTFDHTEIKLINPNAPAQMAEAFEDLGWEPTVFSEKTDLPSLDKFVLEDMFIEGHEELVESYISYKKNYGVLSKFLRPISKRVEETGGLLYPSFNQYNTRTGRLSSSDPNLQNIIARGEGSSIRKLFKAPDGYKVLCGDLDRIEVCVLAYLIESRLDIETPIAQAIVDGEDVHQTNADNWNVARAIAKTVIFLLVYGGGAAKLARSAKISLAAAEAIVKSIHKNSPEIFELRDQIIEEATDQGGVIYDIFGRRLEVPELLSREKGERASGERKVFNYIIQGSAGSAFKMLQLKAYNHPDVRAKLFNVVHDEALYYCREELAEEQAELLSSIYTDDTLLSDGVTSIPIRCKFNIGDNWYEAKEG